MNPKLKGLNSYPAENGNTANCSEHATGLVGRCNVALFVSLFFPLSVFAQDMDEASLLLLQAMAFGQEGKYTQAIPMYQKALKICDQLEPQGNPITLGALIGLGGAYTSDGDYASALPLLERAVGVTENVCGARSAEMATSLVNLSSAYHALGDEEMALSFCERGLAISKELSGLNSYDSLRGLGTLAGIYVGKGDLNKALPLYRQALQISKNLLGSDHPDTGALLNDAAIAYCLAGDLSEGIRLLEESLANCERVSGADSIDAAMTLNNIGKALCDIGKHEEAQGALLRAKAIFSKVLGSDHFANAGLLLNLAHNNYRDGDNGQAYDYAAKAIDITDKSLGSLLLLDERSRLSLQRRNLSISDYAPVVRTRDLARLMFVWKGIVLDSAMRDRALAIASRNNKQCAKLLADISHQQKRLTALLFTSNTSETSLIIREISALQRELTKILYGARRQGVSLGDSTHQIAQVLGDDASLVDFIRFEDPKLYGDEASCYGAVITGKDDSPTFVRIDGASAIDSAIDSLRAAIDAADSAEVEEQTNLLSAKLWQPVAAQLPESTKRLFICPDAKLNFLSFSALMDRDGSFVAEKYPIAYVGSGRDLVRQPSGRASKNLAVFADPTFDSSGKSSTAKEMVAMRSAEADVFATINLPPLPGTKAEAQEIEAIAKQSNWDINISTEDDATELSVRETKSPGVLHLATHGFYLNSYTQASDDAMRGMSVVGISEDQKKRNENGVDPMRASGVALAGAQQTLKLWSQRKAPDPETDGILTAEEVASLDLNGTWLVTLSACETGVGEARSGEGVFGLRRAFTIAGAENLLMTLWPVADDTTASIMADFYKEALATGDAPGSLAKVQRDWLVKLREEKGLAAAIREAGPFAMVMMTAPTHPPVELPPVASSQPAESATEKKSSWWPF